VNPRPLVGVFGAVVVTALLCAAAVAAGTLHAPPSVFSTVLLQSGRQLVWSVELDRSFSPGALRRDHESLCLLIERARVATVISRLCVSGPGPDDTTPQLIYTAAGSAGSSPGRPIHATVTRTNDRELTATFTAASIGVPYQPLRWQVQTKLGAPACVVADCAPVFPGTPVLLALHTPQLVGCVPTGPEFVTSGPPGAREIALTFDDGPWYQPPASRFLDVLEREHVPATFFEIGRQIPVYDPTGAVQRRMLADGDMIGDHTWSHANVAGGGPFAARQLSFAAAAIRKATGGFQPCLFRAPFGAVSPALEREARASGFTTIQWDVDPRDWALPGVNAIYDDVVADAHDGAIVIEHFGGGPRYQTLAALPRVIETLRRRGYTFVTVTQMLGYRLVYK
jgi:peptidoglycan/xylan/chitin deacetylase (PgdA/CDA1 family)